MRYDAFVSYSHESDRAFARAFQLGLEQLAKPWNRRRALNIFRDETDLSINPELLVRIFQVLDQSSHLLLLASPRSASSKWVQQEADHWVSERGSRSLLIILTGGELVWDDKNHDFDWERTDALPQSFRARFAGEPLWVDFRWAKQEQNLTLKHERFLDTVATVAAELHGMSKRDLVGEDLRQHRKFLLAKRITTVAGAVLIAGVALASYLAREQQLSARAQAELALARQLASTSERTSSGGGLELAALLATQSMRRQPTFDGDRALRRELDLLPRTRWVARHESSVNAVAFSRDGKWVATGSFDATARVMEAATGREISRLKHASNVQAVAFSPDGKWVATGSDDNTARVMEAATGKEVSRLKHASNVQAVAFSPDGKWVATGSIDATARVMEAATGKEVSRQMHGDRVNAVAFSPDGRWVVTGTGDINTRRDNEARVMEAFTGREVCRLKHEGPVYAVAFSPDGKWVATGSADNTARVMEAATGKEVSRLKHEGPIYAVAFSPNGEWVATGSDDNTARVMEGATGKEVSRQMHEDRVNAVAFSPNGEWVATGTGNFLSERPGDARVLEWATGKAVARLKHNGRVNAVAFSPDGKWVATGSEQESGRVGSLIFKIGEVKVWEAATSKDMVQLKYEYPVNAVAFSPDAKWVATGSGDVTRVMETATGKEVARLEHIGRVNAVAFSPDGKWVATGSLDATARLMEAATGREISRLKHDGSVGAVAFSPNGEWVATGSADNTARVMEAATGKEVSRLKHEGPIYAVAFSPDGKWVATGSWDATARVWEVATGKELYRIELPGSPLGVRFSNDRRWLEIVHRASYGNDLIYTRRTLEPRELIREACEKVTRNLTVAEWKQYVGAQMEYERTCDNKPFPGDYKSVDGAQIENWDSQSPERDARKRNVLSVQSEVVFPSAEECQRYFQSQPAPALTLIWVFKKHFLPT